MPDALTMNSATTSLSGSRVPAAIASACFAFSRRTNSLNATHSSSFVSTLFGMPDAVAGDRSSSGRCRGGIARAELVTGSAILSTRSEKSTLRLLASFGLDLGERGSQERRRAGPPRSPA